MQAMRLSTAEVTTDSASRERLILDYLPLVRAVARDFVREDADLDDLVQVGTIGLIKAVDGYREDRGSDLGAYAVPTIVGELRRHVRERASASSVAELEEEMLAAGARSQAETSEMRELVRAALDVLGPRERRIVALRYYRDWSQQRIAAEVGLSQVQVSRVLSASLAKMRDRLEAA